jgi:Holliday junction resolvase-like predicted endonuclease
LVADRYAQWGHAVIGRNLRAAGAECDLLVASSVGRVVVEVKTVIDGDPFAQVGEAKDRSLRRLAAALGAARIDVVGVWLGSDGARLHAVHGW